MQFAERYQKLNKPQKKAVDTIEGPLLVVAGPGSGKTEILSLRVAKILKETQVLPSNILCLTFTESAEINMRDRLAKLIGHEAYRVSIHTFHDFSVNIIQRYPEFFYKGAIFSAADPISQIGILEELFENLPHDRLLRSYHPEQGFVYLSDVSKTIANLKRSGITPDELEEILALNKEAFATIREVIVPVLDKTISKKTIEEVSVALKQLVGRGGAGGHAKANAGVDKAANSPVSAANAARRATPFSTLTDAVALSLTETIKMCEETGKNEPLSKWKSKYLKPDDTGKKVFRDELNASKMLEVAEMYRKYREEMHRRGFYDFDDMILDVIEALEKNPRLRYELQEQYQYMLVDEFQDTNNAQMRILKLLADAPVNEGKPNIMVVGDDDQAVYKFQGAVLSNILNFRTMFNEVETVIMTNNYRSTQDILDIATHIIRKGEGRLESLIPEMDKTLIASNPSLKSGSIGTADGRGGTAGVHAGIVHKEFDTSLHEYHFVSREIKKLIDAGKQPEDIAVIARKHKQLEALVPYMQGARVPIRYEREQNVFLEPHVAELIIMARFVSTLAAKETAEADEFLPKILSFSFWALPRKVIWQISRTAHSEGRAWLDVMQDADIKSTEPRAAQIAEFLMDLGVRSQSEPLEKILDIMIGAHVALASDSEDDDFEHGSEEGGDEGDNATKKALPKKSIAHTQPFASPFKEYYFNKSRFEHARAEYLSFLSSLRVFVKALREYKGKAGTHDTLLIKDLVDFVDIHQKNNISLNDESPFANARNAVNLLSAHKAKGLEFDTVFVLSCQDEVWAGRGMIKKISMPLNLPIDPAGDNEDDQLRLFYVALTRAKRNLYMTSYKVNDDGAPSEKLRFLVPPENADEALKNEALRKMYIPDVSNLAGEGNATVAGSASGETSGGNKSESPETSELLTASWLLYHTPPFLGEETELLRSLLDNYQLSVTHLNNYLNVAKGGPQLFLEQNLLRFPQAKTPSGSYGSAVHRALERLSVQFRYDGGNNGKLVDEDTFIEWFKHYLTLERTSRQDFKLYSEKGEKALRNFYVQKKNEFKATDKTEVNFKDQGVLVNSSAHLTGKIDRMIDLGGGALEVHDYKTGKPKLSWQGKDDYEKIRLYEYERQLLFYKILVENAKDFAGRYKVERGVLEFIEPVPGSVKGAESGKLSDLSLNIDKEKVERTAALAVKVYQKIINLDFPDVSKYSKDLEGIRKFEDDLLKS